MGMRTSWILAGLLVVPCTGWAVEHAEKHLSMDQLPSAVRSTVEKESRGGNVGEIEKEGAGRRAYYEAEITKDGKTSYVHVAENGKVLKRETAAQERKSEGAERDETR